MSHVHEGLQYTLNGDNTATLSGHDGSTTTATVLSNFSTNGISYTVVLGGSFGFTGDTITVPSNFTNIGAIFNGASNLTTVNLQGTNITLGYRAFYGCSSLQSFNFDNIASFGGKSFQNSGLLTADLTNSSVTEVKGMDFAHTSLHTIIFSPLITSIGSNSFENCGTLTSITLPPNLVSIGNDAFKNTGLTSITIPASVTTLGSNIWTGCNSLTEIIFTGSSLPTGYITSSPAFNGIPANCEIKFTESNSSGSEPATTDILVFRQTAPDLWPQDLSQFTTTSLNTSADSNYSIMNEIHNSATRANYEYSPGRYRIKYTDDHGNELVVEQNNPFDYNNNSTVSDIGATIISSNFTLASGIFDGWHISPSLDYVLIDGSLGASGRYNMAQRLNGSNWNPNGTDLLSAVVKEGLAHLYYFANKIEVFMIVPQTQTQGPVAEDIIKVIQTMKVEGKSVSELSSSEKEDIVTNTTATYIPITRTMLQDNGIDDTQYNDAAIIDMIRIALSDGSININIVIEFPPSLTGSISTATVNNTLTSMLATVQNSMLDLVKNATGDITLTLDLISGTIDVGQAQTDINSVQVPDLPTLSGNDFVFSSISKTSVDGGATSNERRGFTKNSISSLLTKYQNHLSSGKSLKIQAGVDIPGFANIQSAKDVILFDARVTKAFAKSQLLEKQSYMVLNDNEPVTLPTTNNNTVTVTQDGTNFTVVSPEGTSSKVAGDSFEYDGLSLQFGSLIVNLANITPIDMALPAFDSAFVLTQQAILPDVSYALDVSAEITLTQQISASDLSGVFFFKTDEDITSELVTDTSNVEYYLDRSQFTGGQATMNAMNGLVTTGYYGSNTTDHLGKDFLRDMAHQLFSTHFGVDLFTNEDAVVTDISGKSAIVATDIFTKMGNVDKTNTALSGPDVSYGYYSTDQNSTNTNLTREILNQLLTLSPGRFTDKTTLRLDAGIPGVYGMPFVTNDTISYKLSVTAHASQNTTIATGKPGLETRSYKVIFKIA